MALDFAYPAPPCGIPDTRPLIISRVHFTYFAMLLAGVTAIVTVVISLCTTPPDPTRVIGIHFLQEPRLHDGSFAAGSDNLLEPKEQGR